jgi:hypothetical protein
MGIKPPPMLRTIGRVLTGTPSPIKPTRPLMKGELTVGFLFRLSLIWPFFGGEGVYWPFAKWTEEVPPTPRGAPKVFHQWYDTLRELQQQGGLRRWDVMLYWECIWDCWMEHLESQKGGAQKATGVFGAYSYLGEVRVAKDPNLRQEIQVVREQNLWIEAELLKRTSSSGPG